MSNKFAKYLDDEKFIDWVTNRTSENNTHWDKILQENPVEKKNIELLKECLSYLETKDEKLTQQEKDEILSLISKKISLKRNNGRILSLRHLVRAAILLPLIGLTIYFIRDRLNEDFGTSEVESLLKVSLDSTSSTKLVLSDNSEISIEEKKSEINFRGSDDLVINQKDTLDISNSPTTKNNEVVLNQLIVPYGKRSKLTLGDGTKVHINSGSRLIFPSNFLKTDSRNVFLMGEAYFEVNPDTRRPFTVKVLNDDEFYITATGTKFNVNAYDKNDKVTTVLTEGEVHLTRKVKNKLFSKENKTVMKAGELAEWSISERAIQRKITVDTETYISWVRGLLIFKGETLQYVIESLQRYYNIKIEVEENIDMQYRMTGKLDLNDSIEQTMENLSVAASATYKKDKDNIYVITK